MIWEESPHHDTFPVVVYCRISAHGPFGQANPALEFGPANTRLRGSDRTVAENKRALIIATPIRDIVSGYCHRISSRVL